MLDDYLEVENQHGCTPCPTCGSLYRIPYIRDGERVASCGDCGHEERMISPQKISAKNNT